MTIDKNNSLKRVTDSYKHNYSGGGTHDDEVDMAIFEWLRKDFGIRGKTLDSVLSNDDEIAKVFRHAHASTFIDINNESGDGFDSDIYNSISDDLASYVEDKPDFYETSIKNYEEIYGVSVDGLARDRLGVPQLSGNQIGLDREFDDDGLSVLHESDTYENVNRILDSINNTNNLDIDSDAGLMRHKLFNTFDDNDIILADNPSKESVHKAFLEGYNQVLEQMTPNNTPSEDEYDVLAYSFEEMSEDNPDIYKRLIAGYTLDNENVLDTLAINSRKFDLDRDALYDGKIYDPDEFDFEPSKEWKVDLGSKEPYRHDDIATYREEIHGDISPVDRVIDAYESKYLGVGFNKATDDLGVDNKVFESLRESFVKRDVLLSDKNITKDDIGNVIFDGYYEVAKELSDNNELSESETDRLMIAFNDFSDENDDFYDKVLDNYEGTGWLKDIQRMDNAAVVNREINRVSDGGELSNIDEFKEKYDLVEDDGYNYNDRASEFDMDKFNDRHKDLVKTESYDKAPVTTQTHSISYGQEVPTKEIVVEKEPEPVFEEIVDDGPEL